MTVYGSIISLKEIAKPKYILKISLNEKQEISFELKDVPIDQFAKEFAKNVGVNLFVPPEFKAELI
jgi:type II secretory pathway component GspD/PulD (secretin)